LNVYSGNGSVTPTNNALSNSFGVGLVGDSSGNLIERNTIGGNTNGVRVVSSASGNTIQRNIISGNPPIQVSTTFGASVGADIRDMSPPGANVFEDNRCLTYMGLMAPAPCPSISKPDNDEDQQERDIAAFGRSRLTIPRASLIDAIFRPSEWPRPSAGASPQPRQAGDPPNIVTVTGKVVDAACFMLHAPAATAASHKDCGAACLARGVPLAIAADDGGLYFPADGNQRLKSLLNARVRASGPVVEKHDPMELKMPVGDKNQMVVRVEGGYKQITIQTLEKILAVKRRPA
jgi:parallel beta-helix repeat protein